MKGKKSLYGEFCNYYCQTFVVITSFSPKIVRFQNGCNKVGIELVISNRTRAMRSFDFEITSMISDQIALHSVQLPLFIILKETSDS